jgi:Fe-S oxidoreductase
MWMEERIGTRINDNRTDEALRTLATSASNGHDAIATGCPFCRIMLTDGLTARQADGSAPETTEVLDVAQLLLEAVRRTDDSSAEI